MLATYKYPADHAILLIGSIASAVNSAPGTWVRHRDYEGSFGMMIANGDDFITVLWSVAPRGKGSTTNPCSEIPL